MSAHFCLRALARPGWADLHQQQQAQGDDDQNQNKLEKQALA